MSKTIGPSEVPALKAFGAGNDEFISDSVMELILSSKTSLIKFIQGLQVALGFTNLYQRFI